MAEERADSESTFTGRDHLRLLQLMTRRAMAERKQRSAKRAQASAGDSDDSSVEPVEIPRTWKLVPEGMTLYDWQRECLPIWMAHGQGTFKVATGGGKTLFALAVAERLQNEREPDLRLCIVVPTIPLMFQWYDELRRGNLPDSAIGLMGGSQELGPGSELRILVSVVNSARERLPGFVAKEAWADRMLLVVDECHRANAEQARRIFESRPRFTIGLSATPEQDSEDEGLPTDEAYNQGPVGKALGPILYDFTIKQSLEAGLLTPFEVWHIGLSLSEPEAVEHGRLSREISDLRKSLQARHRKSRSKQGFLAWCQTQASRGGSGATDAERFIGLANRRKRLLYRAQARIDATLGLLSGVAGDSEARTIVFHESIDEIENLFVKALDQRLPAVLEHSQLPDSLRAENIGAFRQGIARVIISAKSLVEGFNVPSADLGIIAASSGSVRQRIQSLGRMLRRKESGRHARIAVLYVRDTEDEAIYEKADWEAIVGAERNRYFHWGKPLGGGAGLEGLNEVSTPPRSYRPASSQVDVKTLSAGESYPAQATGLDLRVDQSGNLRLDDGSLVPAAPELVASVVERNAYRRARRTPAGHLIVRVDGPDSDEPDWRFLGTVPLPDEAPPANVAKLRVRASGGKRVIALEEAQKKGRVRFALGPGRSRTVDAGLTRDQLLAWIKQVEGERSIVVRDLFWDGGHQYWLEIGGSRIDHGTPLAALEFDE